MKISYELKEKDLAPFIHLVANRRLLARLPLIVYGPFLLLVVVNIIPFGYARAPMIGFVPLIMAWPTVIYPSLNRRQTVRRFEQTWGPLGAYTLIWGPEGVHVHSAAGEVAYAWGAFGEVTADSAYYYLWLSKTEAMIVPKQAFKSKESADAFYQAAQEA